MNLVRWRAWGLLFAVYVMATAVTNAAFMADTYDYVTSILTGVQFWEFGHLLWRPGGWLLVQVAAPLTGLLPGLDARAEATLVLVACNWLAGLAAVLLLFDLTRRLTGSAWAAGGAAITFLGSHAVLNFAQSGAPYMPGLTLLLLGLGVLARDGRNPDRSWRTALCAGTALAGSLCTWFVYAGAMPGALAAPLFFFGTGKPYRRLVLRTTLFLILATCLAYGAALVPAGLRSPGAVLSWIAAAGGEEHMRVSVSGAPRAVLGVPRSVLNLGEDGALFKRFLLHDPLNPVSLPELFRHSLLKMIAVYLLLGGLIALQWRSPGGRRLLGFLALSAAPALGFAALCDGGAYERCMPFFPALFLCLAGVLAERPRRWAPLLAPGLAAALFLNNGGALAIPVLRAREERIVHRITDLLPLLGPESVLLTLTPQDELSALPRDFPFAPINAGSRLHVVPVLFPNTYQVPAWQEGFARQVHSVWDRGGEVWIACRMQRERPLPQWNWVEGDDERLVWSDLRAFFSRLETDRESGGDDGFRRLAPSARNAAFLETLASRPPRSADLATAGTGGNPILLRHRSTSRVDRGNERH